MITAFLVIIDVMNGLNLNWYVYILPVLFDLNWIAND